jgi:hypothetical protein
MFLYFLQVHSQLQFLSAFLKKKDRFMECPCVRLSPLMPKAKAVLRRSVGERRYSSYSFSTSALDGGEWSASHPGHALPPGKGPPVPIVQESGWASELVWTEVREKILSPLPGIEPRSPGLPARSRTVYWLSYPAHPSNACWRKINLYKCKGLWPQTRLRRWIFKDNKNPQHIFLLRGNKTEGLV